MSLLEKKTVHGAMCINCREEISNPICPNCFIDRVKKWLEFQNEETNSFEKFSNKFLQKFSNLKVKEAGVCLFCKGEHIPPICSFCLIGVIGYFFEKEKPELLKPFLRIFNYGFKEYRERAFL